jgi:proteasome beta subunit
MNDIETYRKTGTTVVGIIGTNIALLAGDRQSTAFYVSSRMEKKVHKINSQAGTAFSGVVGDINTLLRFLRAEANFFEIERNYPMSVKALITLMSNILHSSRFFPYLTFLLIGGYDKRGPQLVSIDPFGGVSSGENFFCDGSGAPIAYGVLESSYKEKMDEKEITNLAISAITAAKRRDVYTGGIGIDILIFSKDGPKEQFIKYKKEK